MELELNHLPIIDMELGAQLIGSNKEGAEEILTLLIKILPDEIASINQFDTDKNHDKLLASVHKLHGGVSYCGTPRLKKLLSSLELALKQNPTTYPPLLNQLNLEIKLLFEHYNKSH
jgi:HPt (histidine-containing phosphotransfer) domain-containing protein